VNMQVSRLTPTSQPSLCPEPWSRQALRTNLSRAKDLGITCAAVDTDDNKRALTQAMSPGLWTWSHNLCEFRAGF